MAYQDDVEIIHNWREEHSIEDLQRIVERKGYSCLLYTSPSPRDS